MLLATQNDIIMNKGFSFVSKFLIFLSLCSTSLVAYSQGLNTIEPLGNAATVSPSSLGSYVTAVTGTPNYAVPLMSISSGPLSQSISISYNSNGELLKDMGGDVGLGWHLNYGGQISREIRGYPDDYHDGWVSPGHSFDPNDWKDRHAANKNELDSEADYFSWNAGGYSGNFVFERKTRIVKQIPQTDCQIYSTFAGQRTHGSKFDGFEVVLPTGTSYFFGGIMDVGGVRMQRSSFVNISNEDHGWNNASNVTIPTNAQSYAPISWVLYKIRDINRNEISFTYKNLFYREDLLGAHTINYRSTVQNLSNPITSNNIWTYSYGVGNGLLRPCLDGITGEYQSISVEYAEFSTYEPAYTGIYGKRLLSRLTKNTGPTGSSVTLDYGSFSSRTVSSSDYFSFHTKWHKPRLKKVIPHGGTNVNVNNPGIPHYDFAYNATSGLQFPWNGNSFLHEDWLGYSAGNTNYYGITSRSYYYNGQSNSFGSGTRNPQHVWSRKTLLKKIITPAGATINYSYEPNKRAVYDSGSYVEDKLICSSSNCVSSTGWKSFSYDPTRTQTVSLTPENTVPVNGSAIVEVRRNSVTYTHNYSLAANPITLDLASFLSAVTSSPNPSTGAYQFRVSEIGRVNSGTSSFKVSIETQGGLFNDALVSGSRVKSVTTNDNNGNITTDTYSYEMEGTAYSSGAKARSFSPSQQYQEWVIFGSAPQSALRFPNGSNIMYRHVRVSRSGGGSISSKFNIPQWLYTSNSTIHPEDRPMEYDRHLGVPLETRSYKASSSNNPYSTVIYKYEDSYTAYSHPNSTSWRAVTRPNGFRDVVSYQQVKSIAPRLTQTITTIDGKTTTNTISYHWWAKSAAPFATYTSHWDGSVTQTHTDFSRTFAGQSSVRTALRNRNAIMLPTISRTYRNGKKISETYVHYAPYSTSGAKQSSPTSTSLFVPWKTELKQKAISQSGTSLTGYTKNRILSETIKIDSRGRSLEVRTYDKPSITYYRYVQGLIDEVKYLNAKTNYQYTNRLLRKKISANGGEVNYLYDSHNRLITSYTNRLGARTEYFYYDADPTTGKLSSVRIKSRSTSSSPWEYSYSTTDGFGRNVQTLALGTSLSTPNGGANGASGSILLSQTRYNPQGQVQSSFPSVSVQSVNIQNGQQLLQEPSTARITDYVYEQSPRGRLETTILPNGTTRTITYGFSTASVSVGSGYPSSFSAGKLAYIRSIDEDNFVNESLQDAVGNVKVLRRYQGGTSTSSPHYIEEFHAHNLRNQPIRISPSRSTKNNSNYWYTYTYDAFGQLLSNKIPGQPETNRLFDNHGRLQAESTAHSRAKGKFWTYKYDGYNDVLFTYLSTGSLRPYAYSNLVGQVTIERATRDVEFGQVKSSRTRMLDNSSQWLESSYSYDGVGRQKNIENNSIQYLNDPDASKVTFNYLNNGRVGNSISSTRWPSQSVRQTATPRRYNNFDAKGLALKIESRSGNSGAYINRFNQETFIDSYTIHGELEKRRISGNSLSTWHQEIDYQYDDLGRLTQINQPYTGNWWDNTSAIGSNHFNSPSAISGLNASSPQSDRDLYYQKIEYSSLYNSSVQPVNKFLVQYAERQVQGRRPIVETYNYDQSHRLASFQATETSQSGAPLYAFKQHASASYSYDDLGRIQSLMRNGYTNAVTPTKRTFDDLSYSYGSSSHLAPTEVADASQQGYGRAPNSLLIGSDNDLNYNPAGDISSDENKDLKYEYNELGLVSKITKWSSAYSSQAEVTYRYSSGGQLVESLEKDKWGTIVSHIYHRDGQRYDTNDEVVYVSHEVGALRISPNGTSQRIYYQNDHLGNVMLAWSDLNGNGVIEASSELLEESAYYPYGLKRQEYRNQTTNVPFAYNGAEENNGWGLHLTTYRTMAPELAIWGQVDPKAEHDYGRSPYAVNYGNPISFNDPYGDCPNCAAAGIGALIGGVGNLIYQGIQGNVNSFGDGAAAFGIGALAGAAAGFTGGASLAAMGGTASATTLGSAIGTGAVVGGVGGATAGAIEGAGNAAVFQNANLGEAFGAGVRGAVYGGFSGAALGGIGGGVGYYANKVGQHIPGNLDTGVGTGGTGSAGGVAGGTGVRGGTPVFEVGDLRLVAGQSGLDVADASARWGIGISRPYAGLLGRGGLPSWGGIHKYRRGGQMRAIDHIWDRHAFNSSHADVSRFNFNVSRGDVVKMSNTAYKYGTQLNSRTFEYRFPHNIGYNSQGYMTRTIRIHVQGGYFKSAYPVGF